jgi:hypothetical protein
MTNEVLDRAAGFATCQILASAGTSLVGAGAWSLAAGGAGVVPLTLGSLSLLGAGFACQNTPVDGAPPKSDQIDGCANIEAGGYGQLQYKSPGGVWANATGAWYFSQAVRLGNITTYERQDGNFTSSCECYSATDGGTFQGAGSFATEAEANSVKYRIDPTNGTCADLPGDLPPVPEDAFEPIPYTDPETNCTYNVQLLGFVEQAPGMTQDPVYVISGSDALRASGGVVGGCNFSPTVYYGGSGGGGGFGGGDGAPPFPYVPGDGPNGVPNWLDTLGAALAGAAAAIVTEVIASAIADAFATPYPGVTYRMVSVCEKDASGEPISEAVEVPIDYLPAPEAQIARLDAIVELLQASKNFKQPICGDEQPEPEGDWRTISFRSEETSPYGKSRLRKRFRYRSQSGIGLGELIDYWKDFTVESGPYRVRHIGANWGNLEVWAATEDEGKRVIRHAGGEAGIDPDQVGRWSTRRSDSTRLGVSATMRVDTTGGYYWITSRDGSDNRPEIGLLPDQ